MSHKTYSNQSNFNYNNNKRDKIFIAHKDLDDFIQISLDKYRFVDPAQELYDSTGYSANAIISNKSAIPDLVIYNKKFNKNECFYDADTSVQNPFPRLKYILKAKPLNHSSASSSQNVKPEKFVNANSFLKSVYNPETEVKKTSENLEAKSQDLNDNYKFPVSASNNAFNNNNNNTFNNSNNNNNFNNNNSNTFTNKNYDNKREYNPKFDEEQDPEWGDIDVSELKNTKVQFQSLPGLKEMQQAKTINNTLNTNKAEENIRKNEFGQQDNQMLEKLMQKQAIINENFKNENEFKFNNNNNNHINNIQNFPKPANPIIHTVDNNTLFSEDFPIRNNNYNNRNDQQRRTSKQYSPNDISANIPNYKQKQNEMFKTDLTEQNNLIRAMPLNKDMFSMVNEQPSKIIPQNIYNNTQSFLSNDNNERLNQAHEMQLMQNHIINSSGHLINKLINPLTPLKEEEPIQQINQNTNFVPYQGTRNLRTNKQQIGTQPNFNTPISNTVNISNYYDESVSSQKPIPPFLEDPVFIVTKNLFNAGWLLMNQQNKILASFNSLELLGFLEEEVKTGNDLRELCLSDHQTDMFFNPMQLYEVLKESIPRIMETVKKQKGPNRTNEQQFNTNNNSNSNRRNSIGSNNYPKPNNFNNNNQYGNKFDISGVTFDTSLNSDINKRNFTDNKFNNSNHNAYSENNVSSNYYENRLNNASDVESSGNRNNNFNSQQPVNMNINMQFIKNDINLNNFNVELNNNNQEFSKSSKDVVHDLNNVGINASRIPQAQDFTNINYSNLFNTSLSTDFKKNKN